MYALHKKLLLAAACLVGYPSASAQEPSIAGKWAVNWGKERCTLLRQDVGSAPITMIFRTYLGSHRPELLVLNPAWKSDPVRRGEEVEVALVPQDRMAGKAEVAELVSGGRLLTIHGLDHDFFDRLGQAGGISIRNDGSGCQHLLHRSQCGGGGA